MKTVALLVYAETEDAVLEECRRQIGQIPTDEYSFEMFVNPDLDEAWRAAGERDFYIWLHGLVTPVEGAIYSLLDNSSFLGDRALLVGTVQDGIDNNLEGIVFGRNQGDLPAAFFDHCLEGFGVDEDGDGFHGPNPVSKQP